MKNRFDYAIPVISMVAVLLAASTVLAVPTNGDFSDGLNGWTVVSGMVTEEAGHALFEQDEFQDISSLEQTFTLPAGALELSFEREMIIDNGGGTPNTDIFTVYLRNAATNNPLVANPSVEWFYYRDSDGLEQMVPSASVLGNMVTLDVSSFAGMDVILAFELFSDKGDGVSSTVLLDNVNVSVSIIPVPGALLLGVIGSALVGWLRRTKTV